MAGTYIETRKVAVGALGYAAVGIAQCGKSARAGRSGWKGWKMQKPNLLIRVYICHTPWMPREALAGLFLPRF